MYSIGDRRLVSAPRLAVVLTLALVAAFVAASDADAGQLREDVSGSFSDTALNLVEGDNAANLVSGAAKGSGSPTHDAVWEIELTGPSDACGGALEGVIGAYSNVRRYANGDLMYSGLDPDNVSIACFNPATGAGQLTINAMITGGTGGMHDASGSYTASYDVQLLIEDPDGGIAHGSFTGRVTGTS